MKGGELNPSKIVPVLQHGQPAALTIHIERVTSHVLRFTSQHEESTTGATSGGRDLSRGARTWNEDSSRRRRISVQARHCE